MRDYMLEFSQEEIERVMAVRKENKDLKNVFTVEYMLDFFREWDKVTSIFKEYYKK